MPARYRLRSISVLLAVAVLIYGVPAAWTEGKSQTAVSVLTGAYTEAQAIHGQELYYAHCLSCHAEDMTGLDQAPPLAGPQFASVWDGESLWALVLRIDAMPPSTPGMFSREQSVALLAYMLWYNNLPIGDVALSTDQLELEQIVFESGLPGQ